MKDFLAQYKYFSSRASIDYTNYLLVPVGTKQEKSGTLGFVSGTLSYPGSKYWRDERTQILLIETDNPVLYGVRVAAKAAAEKLIAFCGSGCGAEMLATKFGLPKSCAKYTDGIIEMIVSNEHAIPRFFELFAETKDFKKARKFLSLGLAVDEISDFNLLADVMTSTENVDCIHIARRLQITIKEAIKLQKSMTENGGKIITPLVSIAFRKHRNIHDMLVDLNDKMDKNGLAVETRVEVPQKLKEPDGWEYVASPHRLIYISRKHGWCTKLKAYWGRMINGVHFFYHAENGLAMYSEKGELLQAKSPRNERDLSAMMPNQLGTLS